MRFTIATSIVLCAFQTFAASERSISVSGQCLSKITPDRGSVTLVAEFTDKNPSVASKKAQALYENMRTEVRKLDLKDLELETADYSVGEDIEWQNNKKISRGYKATMGLQVVTSEIPRLGEILQKVTSLGIQRAQNLNLFISAKKNKEAHESCLTEAIKNAKQKAEKMAEAANAKIGNVVSLSEQIQSNNPGLYMPRAQMSYADASGGAESATTIEAKSQTISVSVSAVFALQ